MNLKINDITEEQINFKIMINDILNDILKKDIPIYRFLRAFIFYFTYGFLISFMFLIDSIKASIVVLFIYSLIGFIVGIIAYYTK